MTSYGPTASLFTIGPNYTVQQYDLEIPAMVANVQHIPVDQLAVVEEPPKLRPASPNYLVRAGGTQGVHDLHAPDFTAGDAGGPQRANTASPISARSHTNSISSRASSGRVRPFSPPVKSAYSGTTFSMTSPLGRGASQTGTGTSIAYASSASVSSARSRGGSRLRNEVTISPTDKPLEDLFPFTRVRVNDVPYNQHHPPLDESHLTPDDLRRQMLSVVFGWEGDIEGLIRDECKFPDLGLCISSNFVPVSRHAPGSQNTILLSRWLGEHDPAQMLTSISSGTVNASAWMFLALSQMGGQEQANKVGQTFVQRLLEVGDIHASATILLALGDRNDAIEVYVSRNYYMEAILMTCLLMPGDWQRQSYLVRRWGEHVVSNSQQQLAIRCFMCTGVEPSEPWTSPTAPNAPFNELRVTSPEPQLRPTEQSKIDAANRMTVKNSALKLITSFGPQNNPRFKFPGLKSDDRTPTNAPGVTPIAESAVGESALSPGGLGSYRMNNVRSIKNAVSARTATPGSFTRRRLPSIGETPVDVQPPSFPAPRSLPTPVDSSSEKGKLNVPAKNDASDDSVNKGDQPVLLLTSARYEPGKDSRGPSPQTAVQTTSNQLKGVKGLPSPPVGVFETLKEQGQTRNGSRDRKPEGLHIQWPPLDTSEADTSAYPSYSEQTDGTTDARSPSSAFQSLQSTKSPSVSGRSIDQYISSLDEANYYAKQHQLSQTKTRDRRPSETLNSDRGSRKHSSRNGSMESRGRSNNRYIQPAKRSPSSPIPMSPEEFAKYNASAESLGASTQASKHRSRSQGKAGSRVRTPSATKHRHRSTSRGVDRKHKVSSRNASRGRSGDRGLSTARSPTSPLPMSPSGEEIRGFETSLRLVTVDRERLRSQQRSSSRRPDRGTSARRDQSPDRRRARARSTSRQAREHNPAPELPTTAELADQIRKSTLQATLLTTAERTKRELAAAELEARRLSLVRRPSAPNIPLPGNIFVGATGTSATADALESPPSSGGSFSQRVRSKSNASKPSSDVMNGSDSSSSRGRSTASVGLPATPRAMRHPKYSDGYIDQDAPTLPGVPLTLPGMAYSTEAARIGRSMSVPIVDYQPPVVPADLPHHPMYLPDLPRSRSTSRTRGPMGHRRDGSRELNSAAYGSPPAVSVSIENDGIQDTKAVAPPILPELQHLTTPPPPPPAPVMEIRPRNAGTFGNGVDNAQFGNELPRPFTTGTDTQPMRESRRLSIDHRRGRSINESFATKIRNFTGRMRSTSRPGARSPPTEISPDKVSPYESIQMVPAENRN